MPKAFVAVDLVLFTVRDGTLQVLLVERGIPPFKGQWALPGGFVLERETLEVAARRELQEETGFVDVYLEQLYTFGHPTRDPQGRVVSVAYVGLIPHRGRFLGSANGKVAQAAWWPVARLPSLAYDHASIVAKAVERLRSKVGYTNLVYALLPSAFTLSELHAMYEAVLARRLDRRNFRKKIFSLGLLRPLGRTRRGAHRPAALYAFRRRRPMVVEIL